MNYQRYKQQQQQQPLKQTQNDIWNMKETIKQPTQCF